MSPTTMLFVPADRPDRFEKAAASAADAIIIDLEDAVTPAKKPAARENLLSCGTDRERTFIRINAPNTDDFKADLAVLAKTRFRNIVMPKAEEVEDIDHLLARLGSNANIVPLIETGLGVENARRLAEHPAVDFLAFGSLDFALDIGCEHTPDALLTARHRLVLASRLASKASPIDGVTTSIDDADEVRMDAQRARGLGFSGKLVIHPRQIELVAQVFQPSADDVAWARAIMDATLHASGGALRVNGQMVDRPVILKAERILARDRSPN